VQIDADTGNQSGKELKNRGGGGEVRKSCVFHQWGEGTMHVEKVGNCRPRRKCKRERASCQGTGKKEETGIWRPGQMNSGMTRRKDEKKTKDRKAQHGGEKLHFMLP